MPVVINTLPNLSSGMSLSDSGAESSSPFTEDLAFKKILHWVKVRDRSVKETRTRLEREGFERMVAEKAIEKAVEYRFLDDERFADTLVRSRLRQGKGLDGVVRELNGHGIDATSMLPGFPEEYLEGRPSERDCAYALLCRKPPRAKNVRQAAYSKLVRAGYSMSLSAEVANTWFRAFGKTE